MSTPDHKTSAADERVKAFYDLMPFNYHSTAEAAASLLAGNPLLTYPDLDDVLSDPEIKEVLELGCGAGWAANSIALHYGKHVTAVDLSSTALQRAADVARSLGVGGRIQYRQGDLFAYESAGHFDLVLSIGVLHHTSDCRAAFRHASRFARRGGYFFIGLYHHYGRLPFLRYFDSILRAEGEESAFRRFASMNPGNKDEMHLRSWFRDQVLHPRETQHTLEEVLNWLEEDGLTLMSTSLNAYGPVDDRVALIQVEKTFEEISNTRNVSQNSYFPGFFTILAQRGEE